MKQEIMLGDAVEVLRSMESGRFYTCITSPPYFGLRDYGVNGQIGLESTPEEYIARLVEVFREVRRVLRDDGTLWVNIGDSYAGSGKGRYADGHHSEGAKQSTNAGSIVGKLNKTRAQGCKTKDLIGIPWMLAFALRSDGWYLRQDIVWNKSNAMPESVKDRCTRSHEYIFLMSKSPRYYFDAETIREPRVSEKNDAVAGSLGAFGPPQKRRRGSGCKERILRQTPTPHLGGHIPYSGEQEKRNRRDVWTISTGGYKGAHFATFPEKLVEPCVLAGCPSGGAVLDPFAGSGTTGAVAKRLRREFVGIEINEEYAALARRRIEEAEEPMEQLRIEEAAGEH